MAIKEIFEQNTETINLAKTLLEDLADRTGKYVWKKIKQHTVTNPAVTFTPDGQDASGNYKYKVTETDGETIDFVYITDEFFDGFVITTATAWGFIYAGKLYYGQNGALSNACWYEPETHHLVSATQLWTAVHYASYTGDKTYIESVDYVVSDDESSYPDKAYKDGFWYEVLSVSSSADTLLSALGCTKYAVDKFLLSTTATVSNTVISHSLGEKPKYALLIATDPVFVSGKATVNTIFIGEKLQTKCYMEFETANVANSYLSNTYETTVTETTVKITSTAYFVEGVEYAIITLGGGN